MFNLLTLVWLELGLLDLSELLFGKLFFCLVCFTLAGLRGRRLACPLAKLASLLWTMLNLLDLRRLRFARSLTKLASLVRTMLGFLDLLTRRLALLLVELANSRF